VKRNKVMTISTSEKAFLAFLAFAELSTVLLLTTLIVDHTVAVNTNEYW
jgi:cell division protein FtsL